MNRFEQMADRYDTPERQNISNRIADEIAKSVIPDVRAAMDFGCGTGLVGLQLAHLFESLLLVDTSARMVEITQAKINEKGIQNATALQRNLLEEPILDKKFDCIFMAQVLLHIPDTQLVFETMRKMLHGGGQLIIVDFDKTPAVSHPEIHNGFEHSELADLAETTGFSNISTTTFYRGKNIFAKQDASMFIFRCSVSQNC